MSVPCVGTLGSGDLGYPSVFRNVGAQVPVDLQVDEKIEALEKVGFSIIDFDSRGLQLSMYAWRRPEPLDEIANLQPFFQHKVSRPG